MSGTGKNDQEILNTIFQKLQEERSLSQLLPEIEEDILAYLHAERITIYQKAQGGREIVSRYHSEDNQVLEIRLPLTSSSIAGYVAMSHRSLRLDDVYDTPSLTSIHPNLQFDRRFDAQSGFRSRSMMVIPVKFGSVLLGLLQVINRTDGGIFTEKDMSRCQELAKLVSHKLRSECQTTRGPFDLLVQEGHVTQQQLNELRNKVGGAEDKLEKELLEMGIHSDHIGKSLERYYQVPFFPFTNAWLLPGDLWKDLNIGMLKRYLWVPVAGSHQRAVVAINDPSDVKRIMEMQGILKADSYEIRVSLVDHLLKFIQRATEPVKNEPPPPVEAEPAEGGEGFIIQLANRLIATALRSNADELSIRPHPDNASGLTTLRVGQEIRTVASLPPDQWHGVVQRLKSLAQLENKGGTVACEGIFTVKMGGKILEMSIATLPNPRGEGIVVKLLKK
ncbi:MAG: GAF domain-containing protein [Magnetococcales bacterium]|nr:GAF domain-containing protein [Magnetococcales bacterium]NGZ26989.1 GAF domain-containing protein [Magnetococcales bacterium]